MQIVGEKILVEIDPATFKKNPSGGATTSMVAGRRFERLLVRSRDYYFALETHGDNLKCTSWWIVPAFFVDEELPKVAIEHDGIYPPSAFEKCEIVKRIVDQEVTEVRHGPLPEWEYSYLKFPCRECQALIDPDDCECDDSGDESVSCHACHAVHKYLRFQTPNEFLESRTDAKVFETKHPVMIQVRVKGVDLNPEQREQFKRWTAKQLEGSELEKLPILVLDDRIEVSIVDMPVPGNET